MQSQCCLSFKSGSEPLAEQLEQQLVTLILQTTLDKGQLVNFIDSLRNTVHLTQGPPGTGKSYLGVVLVRALLRIRNLWIQQNPSVGYPPILVLSYNNHATDEFLCDFLQAERSSPSMGERCLSHRFPTRHVSVADA